MHLGRVVSHQGIVIETPGAWALSGLRAYEHLPCGGARPMCFQEPVQRVELACGVL
jgi:hypothetical protein